MTSEKSIFPRLRDLDVAEEFTEEFALLTIEYRNAIQALLHKLPKEIFERLADAGEKTTASIIPHDASICREATYLRALFWHVERAKKLAAAHYCVYHACDMKDCRPHHEVKMETGDVEEEPRDRSTSSPPA